VRKFWVGLLLAKINFCIMNTITSVPTTKEITLPDWPSVQNMIKEISARASSPLEIQISKTESEWKVTLNDSKTETKTTHHEKTFPKTSVALFDLYW
jgi:hypothetical protein